MTGPTPRDIELWIACAIGVYILLRKVWPTFRRFVSTGDAIGALPAFTAEMRAFKEEVAASLHAVGQKVDGLGDRVVTVVDQVEVVRRQVENSHVTNLRDDMDVIKDGVTRLEANQTGQASLIAAVVERQNQADKALSTLKESQ